MEKSIKRKQSLSVLYTAIVLAIALRLYRLGDQSLWGDEALTLLHYAAGNSVGEMWHRIWTSGGHPPLYFLTVFHWLKLGHSEFMLRFPSLVTGIAAVPLMYALVNRLYGPGTAGISALIVALSPIHVWYSQEARMYSLQIVLLLASTLFMVKAWQEQRFRYHLLFAVLSIAALYTHMASALFIAGQGLFTLITHAHSRRALAVWIGLFVLIGAAFTPWALAFISDNAAESGNMGVGFSRETGIMDSAYAFYTLSVGYTLGPSVAELHEFSGRTAMMKHWPGIAIPAYVFGALVLLGLRRARKSNPGALMLILSLLGVPTALAALGSQLPGFPLNPRYILPTAIPYWILLTQGIQACSHKRVLMVIPAAAVAITGLSLRNHYYEPGYMKQDMRSATRMVDHHAREGDVIIISSVELGGPFIYYHEHQDVPYHGYPHSQGMVDASRLDTDMRALTAGRNRVWLILGRTWSSDPDGLLKQYFAQRSQPMEHRRYQGVTVACYDLTQSSLDKPTKP